MSQLHHDPVFRALVRAQLSRRSVLRGAGFGGLAALLAACGTEGTGGATGTGQAAQDLSDNEKVVDFSNWPLYIDEDEQGNRPTLDAFTEETGIEVNYVEDINDNTSYFAKIQPQLEAGQSIDRDVIVLTDWMASRLIQLGYLNQLGEIPNAGNLVEALRGVPFDADRSYTLPWQSGLTGIGYNQAATGKEIRSLDQLFDDPDLAGRVTLLSEMRDTMGLVLLSMGKSPGDFTDADFDAAIERLQKAVDSGQIRQFTGNEYAPELANGNIAACTAWSGDVIQLQFENPDIQFVLPDAGGIIWSDNMMVPVTARHQGNAEKLMDYYYRPEVAAEVAAWVNYICPVEGAREAMAEIDPELADNQLIFPDEETLSRTHSFKEVDDATEQRYNEAFERVIGG